MQFSSNNFGHKERRLIYFADESPTGVDRAMEAIEGFEKNPEAIAAEGVAEALGAIKLDEAAQKSLLERIRALAFTGTRLEALRKKIFDTHNVELDELTGGEKVEGVEIKTAAPAAQPGPNAGPDGKPIISKDTQTRIEQAGSKLGATIKKFIEALMPLIKSIQKIVNDLKKMIADIVDNFNYDGSKLATTDKFIDRQIVDPELSAALLNTHKENTIREIKAIDKASDPVALQSKRDIVTSLKQKKEEKVAAKSDDPIEQDKLTKQYDRLITAAEKVVSDMETKQRTGKTRRPKLIARLAAINSRMKLAADDGLNGPSSPSNYTAPAPEAKPKTDAEIKAAREKAARAKEAAEKTDGQKAVESLIVIESLLKEKQKKDAEIDEKIAELNKILVAMDKDERAKFFADQDILSDSAPADQDHRMMKTSDGTQYEVRFNEKFELDFVKYEQGAEE